MNAELKMMKQKVGKYAVSNSMFREHGRYGLVEVAEDQSVRRLNGYGGGMNYLSDDGWSPDTTVWRLENNGDTLVRINDPEDRIDIGKWRQV